MKSLFDLPPELIEAQILPLLKMYEVGNLAITSRAGLAIVKSHYASGHANYASGHVNFDAERLEGRSRFGRQPDLLRLKKLTEQQGIVELVNALPEKSKAVMTHYITNQSLQIGDRVAGARQATIDFYQQHYITVMREMDPHLSDSVLNQSAGRAGVAYYKDGLKALTMDTRDVDRLCHVMQLVNHELDLIRKQYLTPEQNQEEIQEKIFSLFNDVSSVEEIYTILCNMGSNSQETANQFKQKIEALFPGYTLTQQPMSPRSVNSVGSNSPRA